MVGGCGVRVLGTAVGHAAAPLHHCRGGWWQLTAVAACWPVSGARSLRRTGEHLLAGGRGQHCCPVTRRVDVRAPPVNASIRPSSGWVLIWEWTTRAVSIADLVRQRASLSALRLTPLGHRRRATINLALQHGIFAASRAAWLPSGDRAREPWQAPAKSG
jgi:hypothetical protein